MSSTRSAMSRSRQSIRMAAALWLGVAAAALGSFGAQAAAPSTEAPKKVIEQTMDEVVTVLKNRGMPAPQRREKIESIAYARFDFDRMSRLVLAKNWNQLNKQQQDQFGEEFRKHLSVTYGRRLDTYTDEKISVEAGRPESNGDVTVKTKIVGGAAGSGVAIDYRLRDREGQWLVIDVIIEGVSLIQNFRTQVQEIISAKGVDSLIEILRDKNAKDAAAPAA
jgi:phospholipid transport system substrate-binding protein